MTPGFQVKLTLCGTAVPSVWSSRILRYLWGRNQSEGAENTGKFAGLDPKPPCYGAYGGDRRFRALDS